MRLAAKTMLTAAFLASGVAASETFSSLEERMTYREFRETGLDKLTPQELARLNAWLRQAYFADRPAPAGAAAGAAAASGGTAAGTVATGSADRPTPPPMEERSGLLDWGPDRDEIRSEIVSEFEGFFGRGTRFELANGMIWEQVDNNDWRPNVSNPVAIIKPRALGTWAVQIEGFNRRIRVERLR